MVSIFHLVSVETSMWKIQRRTLLKCILKENSCCTQSIFICLAIAILTFKIFLMMKYYRGIKCIKRRTRKTKPLNQISFRYLNTKLYIFSTSAFLDFDIRQFSGQNVYIKVYVNDQKHWLRIPKDCIMSS